jgi:hypothetical protein
MGAFVTSLQEGTTMPQPDTAARERHGSPIVAFIIGLSIITLASILNAAGLNLTKLDHVGLREAIVFSTRVT